MGYHLSRAYALLGVTYVPRLSVTHVPGSYTYGTDLIAVHATESAATTTSYFTYDGGGTVRELTDVTGAITDSYDYDAYGILIFSAGTTDNAYLYRGEQFDEDIGLYYLRARFMNPDSRRFWNMDTYKGRSNDPMTLHKYLYANSFPVFYIDPSGFFSLGEIQVVQYVQKTLRGVKGASMLKRINRFRKTICTPTDELIWEAHHLVPLFMGGPGSRRTARTSDLSGGFTFAIDPLSHKGLHALLNIMFKIYGLPPGNTKTSRYATALRKRKKKPEDGMQVLVWLPKQQILCVKRLRDIGQYPKY